MNVDILTQQLKGMYTRLDQMYKSAGNSPKMQTDMLPIAFKELGLVSEELHVTIEYLQQQNEQLEAARAEVEREKLRYQQLFELAPDAYIIVDAAGIVQEANRATARMLKVSQRFLVGKPLVIFVTEDERQTFFTQLMRLQRGEKLPEWMTNLSPRQGEHLDVAITADQIANCTGVIGLQLCIRQITQLRHSMRSFKQIETPIEQHEDEPSQKRQKYIYLKGEIIPLKPHIIWQVSQGIVKLTTMSENGEEVLLGLIEPTMPFGIDLTSLKIYQATALTEVHLECFKFEDLTNLPSFAQKILPQIYQRLQQTEALLAISGERRVKDRFVQLLQLLKQEFGEPVEQGTRLSVRLTHQNFADACSTTRVTITRLLSRLQEQGQIMIDSKNHIIIKN